ncbi:hypothetical protein C7212DRAFT_305473, partial [Tuber magnatum]
MELTGSSTCPPRREPLDGMLSTADGWRRTEGEEREQRERGGRKEREKKRKQDKQSLDARETMVTRNRRAHRR